MSRPKTENSDGYLYSGNSMHRSTSFLDNYSALPNMNPYQGDPNSPEPKLSCTRDLLSDDSQESIWKMYTNAKLSLPYRERIENLTWRLMTMKRNKASSGPVEANTYDAVATYSENFSPQYGAFQHYDTVDDNDYLSQLKRIAREDHEANFADPATSKTSRSHMKRSAADFLSPIIGPTPQPAPKYTSNLSTSLSAGKFFSEQYGLDGAKFKNPGAPFGFNGDDHTNAEVSLGPIEEFANSFNDDPSEHWGKVVHPETHSNGISIKRASIQHDYYSKNSLGSTHTASPATSAASSFHSSHQGFSNSYQNSLIRGGVSGISRVGSLSAFPPSFPGSASALSTNMRGPTGSSNTGGFYIPSVTERNASLLVENGFNMGAGPENTVYSSSPPVSTGDTKAKSVSSATASIDRYMEQHYAPPTSLLSTPSGSNTNLAALGHGGLPQSRGFSYFDITQPLSHSSSYNNGNEMFMNDQALSTSQPTFYPGSGAITIDTRRPQNSRASENDESASGNSEYLHQLSAMSGSLKSSIFDLASSNGKSTKGISTPPTQIDSKTSSLSSSVGKKPKGTGTKKKAAKKEEVRKDDKKGQADSPTGSKANGTSAFVALGGAVPYQPPSNCSNCNTKNTPLWRRGPGGEPLCNACGLFLKLHGVVRPLSLKTDVIKKRQRSAGSTSDKEKNDGSKKHLEGVDESEESPQTTATPPSRGKNDGDNFNPPPIGISQGDPRAKIQSETQAKEETADFGPHEDRSFRDGGGIAGFDYQQSPDLSALKNLADTPQLLSSTIYSVSKAHSLTQHGSPSSGLKHEEDSHLMFTDGRHGVEDGDVDMSDFENASTMVHNGNLDWLVM